MDGRGEKRPPPLAADAEPLAPDALRMPFRGAEQIVEDGRLEPSLHGVLEAAEIEAPRGVGGLEVDVIPHPVVVDHRVDAIVLEEGNGDGGDRGCLDERVRLLEDWQTADANDGFDLPGLDHRHHQRRALGDEDGIAEPLRFGLEVLDRAEPAALAEEAKLIKRRRAAALHAEALRHQKEAAMVGHGGQGIAPRFVVDEHPGVVEMDLAETNLGHRRAGPGMQLLHPQRRHRRLGGKPAADRLEERRPLRLRLRDLRMGGAGADQRRRDRRRENHQRQRGSHRGAGRSGGGVRRRSFGSRHAWSSWRSVPGGLTGRSRIPPACAALLRESGTANPITWRGMTPPAPYPRPQPARRAPLRPVWRLRPISAGSPPGRAARRALLGELPRRRRAS